MKKVKLPKEYATVLLQIKLRGGEEDFIGLAESLRINPARLRHIIQNLQHKGLILVSRSTYSDAWIGLSGKGQRLLNGMNGMWPQAASGMA
jgi:hypothetical protein